MDDGLIGEPVGVAGSARATGVETWHPDPTSHFRPCGGPVQNMGPYYLTAMVNLLGPLASVSARGRVGRPAPAGPGVAGLVDALGGAPHRAGAALACHVLDAIDGIETSSESGIGSR